MVCFKLLSGDTIVEVIPTDSVDDIELFFREFESGTILSNLAHVTYGYPVYCDGEKIGYVALSCDDMGLVVVHHYTLGRVELRNRPDIRDFYIGEYDNRTPF